MRSARSAWYGLVVVSVALGAVSGCAWRSGTGYSEEMPSQRMTGMETNAKVTRVDQPQQVIVLDNGQMYRVSGPNAVYVDGRPVALDTVQPGSTVTIVSGTPVYYQNGQYVTTAPSGAVAPSGVLTPSTVVPAPGPVVVAPGTAVATAPAGSMVRIYGRVVDVDRDEIKIRTQDGRAFEVRMPAGTVVHKGDPVTVDMTFGAAPSASPR
jgi:hypothetical protein